MLSSDPSTITTRSPIASSSAASSVASVVSERWVRGSSEFGTLAAFGHDKARCAARFGLFAIVNKLQRVRDGCGGDGARCLFQRTQQRRDGVRRNERAGRVMISTTSGAWPSSASSPMRTLCWRWRRRKWAANRRPSSAGVRSVSDRPPADQLGMTGQGFGGGRITGRPLRHRNCFGMSAPKRVPSGGDEDGCDAHAACSVLRSAVKACEPNG